jgi:hypothetical protein
MKQIKISVLSAIVLLMLFHKSFAQIQGATSTVSLPKGETSVNSKSIVYQKQIWARLYNRIKFNDKWTLHTEVEVRRYVAPSRAYQTMLPRIHIHRTLGNSGWEALVGVAYFTNTQNVNDPTQRTTVNVPEIRPMIGLDYSQKTTKRLELGHRYWLEERFQHNYNSTTDVLTNGYQFNFRARYRFQAQYAIIKKETSKGTLRINFSDEIFINVSKAAIINTFDQNRIFAGLDYGLSKNFNLQAGYYQIYQASSSTAGKYYRRDALRVTLFYNINASKKDQ